MSTQTLRSRVLRGLDQVVSRLPEDHWLWPRNDVGEALSPFLHGLRHLRRLATLRAGTPTVQQLRRQLQSDMRALRVGFPVGDRRDMILNCETGSIAARYYRPDTDDVLPVLLVYFHGGGFVMGDLDTHDDACRLLCQESGMPLLSVAYRLAPEHPFPAAVDDAEAAVRWAFDHLSHLGLRAVAVGGDSAGANLATVTAQTLATDRRPPLAQLIIYPGTDLTTPRPSHQLFGEGYFLNQSDRELFYSCYLNNQPWLGADPRVSPQLNQVIGVQPPALLATAGFDMLRDEGNAYARYLRQAGTLVEQLHFDKLGHGFINLASVHTHSRQALETIARQWRQLCKQQLITGNHS